MIADPPLEAGAVNATLARALPATALPMAGTPGTVIAARTERENPSEAPSPARQAIDLHMLSRNMGNLQKLLRPGKIRSAAVTADKETSSRRWIIGEFNQK